MKNSRFVLTMIVGSCFAMPAHAFVQTDLDSLLKTNACPKCDLSGAMLAGMDLSKAKLEGANLAGADLAKTSLRMADLAGANLSGAMLQGTIFEAADLFKANLSRAQLDGAIFEGAYLAEATIDESQREKLAGVNSSPQGSPPQPEGRSAGNAVLEAGQGKETALESAGQAAVPPSLAEPPFAAPEAAASGLTSTYAKESGRVEPPAAEPVPPPTLPLAAEQKNPLTGNQAANSINQEALLKQAKRSGVCVDCDFSGMTLGGVSLKGLYLERANFAAAQMAGANFSQAILKAAKFRAANLQGAIFKGADLYLADFSGANMEGTDFRGAAMDGAILTDAILTGAQFDASPK